MAFNTESWLEYLMVLFATLTAFFFALFCVMAYFTFEFQDCAYMSQYSGSNFTESSGEEPIQYSPISPVTANEMPSSADEESVEVRQIVPPKEVELIFRSDACEHLGSVTSSSNEEKKQRKNYLLRNGGARTFNGRKGVNNRKLKMKKIIEDRKQKKANFEGDNTQL